MPCVDESRSGSAVADTVALEGDATIVLRLRLPVYLTFVGDEYLLVRL